EFTEVGQAPPQGQPHRPAQGPRLRHQQDQPALQGPPGLTPPRPIAAAPCRSELLREPRPSARFFVLAGAPTTPLLTPGGRPITVPSCRCQSLTRRPSRGAAKSPRRCARCCRGNR